MRAMTRDSLSDATARAWGRCFGPPVEMTELTADTEEQRLFACAVVFADDLRHLPETGLADAPADMRFLFARAFVGLLRDVETGRIDHA